MLLLIDSDQAKVETGQKEVLRMVAKLEQSRNDLINVGYNDMTFDMFLEMMVELVSGLPAWSMDDLYDAFVNSDSANYYTWYMRLLTAGFLKTHFDRFFPFIDNGSFGDMADYCTREVE